MSALSENAVLVGELLIALVIIGAIILGRRIDARLGAVHFELKPNGGATLRDSVDRIEARVVALEAFVDEVKAERES